MTARTLSHLTVIGLMALAANTSVLTQARGAVAPAQQPPQRVLPPEARYWMGVTTVGGMMAMGLGQGGRPSIGDLMRLGAGGVPSEAHSIELRLGSTLTPSAGPEATHAMPPGSQVNQPIVLQTPEAARPGPVGTPQPYGQPKGQIRFYWGCGEATQPGQPVVLTFDRLLRGENDPALQALQGSVSAREVSKPTAATSKTYADWPNSDRANRNRDLRATFPVGSTLTGQHTIASTYAPTIEFTLANGQSYMEAVRYTSSAVQPSGAMMLTWGAVPRATGYSVAIMAPERAGDDAANMVMWSSAERPATFIQNEDLTPGEVDRLINLKAVLPASTTSCAIPADVLKATKDGSMLLFTAFGDEATFIAPARPVDPATTWDQEWFSRVSFKSTRMDMVSPQGVMDLTGAVGGRGTAAPAGAQSDEEYCKALEAERQRRATAGGGLGGRIGGRLGGLLGGRNRQPEEPVDPRCVKK